VKCNGCSAIRNTLKHGSSTRGPPNRIVRPTTTFVNYVSTIKVTQSFRCSGVPLAVIFPRAASEPAPNNGCRFCHKILDTHVLKQSFPHYVPRDVDRCSVNKWGNHKESGIFKLNFNLAYLIIV